MEDERKWTTSKILIYLALVISATVGAIIFFYGWFQHHFRNNEDGFKFAGIGLVLVVVFGLITQIVVWIMRRKKN